MTDLHTHILPGLDDGAKTEADSIDMLKLQWEQGIDTVVLTPHYYPAKESADRFLKRREAAFERLKAAIYDLSAEEQESLPRLVLGAEVAYEPGLAEMPGIQELCIGTTKNMLLELPFYPWNRMLLHQLYDLIGQVGVTPVLAHMERYFFCQDKKLFNEILELGLPVQVGTDILTRAGSPAMKLLRKGRAHLVASDCHDLQYRKPNLGQALAYVKKKLGQEHFDELVDLSDQLAGENG